MIETAWADAAAPQGSSLGPALGPTLLEQMFPLLFLFIVMYFLMFRPRQAQLKKHSEFLSKLKRGDSVITTGGILGTVDGVTEKFVTLGVSDDVRIRILKNNISGPAAETEKR